MTESEGTRQANHTAGDSSASVASLQRLIVATLTEVILLSVGHTGAANHAQLSVDHNLVVFELKVSVAVVASGKVTEVTDVAHFRGGAAVGLAVGVVVGASSLAPFDQVS